MRAAASAAEALMQVSGVLSECAGHAVVCKMGAPIFSLRALMGPPFFIYAPLKLRFCL